LKAKEHTAPRKDGAPRKIAKPIVSTEVGWCELIHIPSLGIANAHAKMDSGAATSSIHATRIVPMERGGEQWVSFLFRAAAGEPSVRMEAKVIERRKVRSSNGKEQIRYVIRAKMCLGAICWDGQLTLANRGTMAFPVLIGRRSLRRGFLVNSKRRWTLGAPEKTIITKEGT
jgi:hypothetical protein